MKIGFNCSAFDLFHAGHVLMLKEAKQHCDWMIVGLQTDPTIDRPETKNKPIQTVFERFVQISGCKYVDEVLVYDSEEDLMNIMKTIHFDIRFLGEEYKEKDFTGKQWCIDNGKDFFYHSRKHDFSSSNLRTRVFAEEIMRNEKVSK